MKKLGVNDDKLENVSDKWREITQNKLLLLLLYAGKIPPDFDKKIKMKRDYRQKYNIVIFFEISQYFDILLKQLSGALCSLKHKHICMRYFFLLVRVIFFIGKRYVLVTKKRVFIL